jgi:putative tricarboxylic transport membrane protein
MTYRDLWLGAGLAVLSALLYLVVIPVGVRVPSSVRSPVMSPDFWPNIIALFMLGVSTLLVLRGVIAWRRGEIIDHRSTAAIGEDESAGWNGQLRALAVILLLFVYYWLILKIGLVPASMFTMLAVGLTTSRPKLWLLLIATPVLPMLIYLFFYEVASVPIPGGDWLVFP